MEGTATDARTVINVQIVTSFGITVNIAATMIYDTLYDMLIYSSNHAEICTILLLYYCRTSV